MPKKKRGSGLTCGKKGSKKKKETVIIQPVTTSASPRADVDSSVDSSIAVNLTESSLDSSISLNSSKQIDVHQAVESPVDSSTTVNVPESSLELDSSVTLNRSKRRRRKTNLSSKKRSRVARSSNKVK